MMQRRHYELIAQVLLECKPTQTKKLDDWKDIVENFAAHLRRDNPQFKPDRFYKAAGVD